MIAILCLFLKRMRGLATFSLFHILLGANLLLSMGKTNGWKQIQSAAGGLLKRKHAHKNVLPQGNYASVIEDGQKFRLK